MTNVTEMTHQELIDGAKGRWGLGKVAVCEAELLRRLAVSASPQPRCPNCSGALSFTHNKVLTFLSCNGRCKETFELHSAKDMVKLFAAAPAQEPIEMYLCETQFLFLKPNQLYRFTIHPHCCKCKKAAAQEQPVENSPQLDDSRCAICGWPLAESPKKGCTRGNCSMRPWPDNIYDPARANKEYKTERFTERP